MMSNKEPIKLYHRALLPVGDSLYKRECPFCGKGIFLVTRDRDTFQLEEYDNCIFCGTVVQWMDIKKMRKKEGLKDK